MPIISITSTKLVTIVPPVATAVINRKTQKIQKLFAKLEATPKTSWKMTAITSEILRPKLSDKAPKNMLPTRIPAMKVVCDKLASFEFSQTKSHSLWIVLVNTLELNTCDGHVLSHLSRVWFEQENSGLGPRKIIAIWCHATGNFSRKTIVQTNICHRPRSPGRIQKSNLLF